MSTAEIRQAALKLTDDERAQLSEDLLTSLDRPDQAVIDAAWAKTVESRIDAINAGAKTIPAEEVFRQIENRRR